MTFGDDGDCEFLIVAQPQFEVEGETKENVALACETVMAKVMLLGAKVYAEMCSDLEIDAETGVN